MKLIKQYLRCVDAERGSYDSYPPLLARPIPCPPSVPHEISCSGCTIALAPSPVSPVVPTRCSAKLMRLCEDCSWSPTVGKAEALAVPVVVEVCLADAFRRVKVANTLLTAPHIGIESKCCKLLNWSWSNLTSLTNKHKVKVSHLLVDILYNKWTSTETILRIM